MKKFVELRIERYERRTIELDFPIYIKIWRRPNYQGDSDSTEFIRVDENLNAIKIYRRETHFDYPNAKNWISYNICFETHYDLTILEGYGVDYENIKLGRGEFKSSAEEFREALRLLLNQVNGIPSDI
jgi:hypothetical protein